MKKLFDKYLPKWPCLIVIGEQVTKEQASEILIRTDDIGSISCNDRNWEEQLNDGVYGVKANWYDLDDAIRKKHGLDENNWLWDWKSEYLKQYRLLNLGYLCNRQIAYSYIGGPHGWCDWNGRIFCNSFNIGKYPSVEDVYNEWVIIAKAFPFLNLKCQLMSGEQCEDNIVPVIQFNVKKGKVQIVEPKEQILPVDAEINFNCFFEHGERGCTIEQFKDALNICKN